MRQRLNISIYLKKEDKEIIEEASELSSLNKSAFCRNSSILHARKIIQENKENQNAN